METPPIVVLNLRRRSERWAAWSIEAKRAGITNYRRWEAIDGYRMTMAQEIQHLFRFNDFNMERGVMGCALSHMNIWLHIVENNIPALIIFEDDARFNEPFAVPDLPLAWDLFYFGGGHGIYPPGDPISDMIIIPKQSENLYLNTLAYMISYNGANKLLKRLGETGFNRAVDWFMIDMFENLNVFCYKKLIVTTNKHFRSDVKS